MATRRKSIQIADHDRRILVELYLQWRTPIEQFEALPDKLRAFVDDWSRLTGRSDAPGDVLHYMRTQRKRGKWVRLEGNHPPPPPVPELSAEETEILVTIYEQTVAAVGSGSDVLGYDEETAELIATAFAEQTGRIFPAHQLVRKLTALRKRGLLPKAVKQEPHEGGFEDIDDVSV